MNMLPTAMLRQTSIRFRIFLLVGLMLSLLFFAAAYAFLVHLEDVREEKRQSLRFIVSELLSETATQSLSRGSREQLLPIVETLLQSTEITRIAILDSQGDTFLKSLDGTYDIATTERITIELHRNNSTAAFGALDADATAVGEKTVRLGRLEADIDQKALSAFVWASLLDRSAPMLLAVLLSIPAVYVLAASLVGPLASIMEDLDRFESGDYRSVGGSNVYKDEFAQLSAALARAGASITAKTSEIQAANTELKQYSRELEEQVLTAIEARRQANEANARKDIFVANISHELKTPLAGVVSGLDLAEQNLYQTLSNMEGVDPNRPLSSHSKLALRNSIFQVLRSVEIAQYSGRQIHGLVDKILTSIQEIHDDVALDEKTVCLLPSLCRLLDQHELFARHKGLDFHFETNGLEDAFVTTDWVRLAQVINALLSNAIRFTDSGSVGVTARGSTTEDTVDLFLTVVDTGIGVTESESAAIFELFHAGVHPRKKQSSGIGTGLAIAKRICNKMGATISFRQNPTGRGTYFSLECRFKRLSDTVPGKQDRAGSRPAIVSNLNLLYVEDSLINQMIFQQYCQRAGINLIMAGNGEEGFQKYAKGRFDALVVDCYMPLMDGFELVSRIRQHEGKHNTAKSLIIAMTADDSDQNRKRCSDYGFDDFVTKPFTEETYQYLLNEVATYRTGPR